MVFKNVDEIDGFEFKEQGASIQGIYVAKNEDVGKNHSNTYVIEVSPNERKSIWGSHVLDKKMDIARIGNLIRITFDGIVEVEGGNDYKKFSVEIDDGVEEQTE